MPWIYSIVSGSRCRYMPVLMPLWIGLLCGKALFAFRKLFRCCRTEWRILKFELKKIVSFVIFCNIVALCIFVSVGSFHLFYMLKKNVRFIALILLLVFFQKAGAGLWVHELVHVKSAKDDSSSKEAGKSSESEACNCVDDFFVPMEMGSASLLVFVSFAFIILKRVQVNLSPLTLPFFYTLRGPPCIFLPFFR